MNSASEDDLIGCRNAHQRLGTTIQTLTDEHLPSPSRLPGWTIGHVVAHLARHADSHAAMFEAAQRGEVTSQYPGGFQQRVADIEQTATRPLRALIDDIARSTARLEAAWHSTRESIWKTGRGRIAVVGNLPLPALVFLRWREVEVHHADLGLGFTWTDWSPEYVEREFPLALDGLPLRLDENARARILAWLLDRSPPDTMPALRPWLTDPKT